MIFLSFIFFCKEVIYDLYEESVFLSLNLFYSWVVFEFVGLRKLVRYLFVGVDL